MLFVAHYLALDEKFKESLRKSMGQGGHIFQRTKSMNDEAGEER